MKKLMKICLTVLVALTMISINPIKAASSVSPTAQDNLNVRLRRTSQLVTTSTGYMRVFYDGKKVGIEYYDNNFNIQSKKSIAMELSIWGGFYASSDAYYLVEGQNNTKESDTAEVIRVIKYDKNWNKKGTAKVTGNTELFGGEVRYPFDAGCVEMTEYDGTLYIVTGHEGYVDPQYNQGHQGFLMIAVNMTTMSGKIVDSDLWHSFAQYITCKDSNLYVLEQSEGSRYTKLSKYNANNLENTSFSVLDYGGSRDSAWAISCYASVDGMALSSNNVLCLGTSIDQSKYDNVTSDTAHNIYLTITPMGNFSKDATTVKWLTNYSGGGKCFLGTKITKVNNNRFMVSWEEFNTSKTVSIDDGLSGSILHYVFIDGNGNKISKEFTASAPMSECQPIVKGTKISYYASNANMVNFYSIDAQTGQFSKKVYRVAGEKITWKLSNNVLTLSGTGPISIDTEAHYRYPVSSTVNSYSYSSSDNAWKPIRDKVKKIVIGKGITSIPESAFEYYNNLTEVQIEPGLKSIGKKAFYSCDALRKITIPSSVSSIGEDILWTGYYWVSDNSHVVRAKIYAPRNSYAITYAKNNKIGYVLDISTMSVSGIKASYTYNGKAQKPTVTITGLKAGTDYTVTYSNNTSAGKATVRITGQGNYVGTITKTFTIAKRNVSTLTYSKISNKSYTGKQIKPSLTVKYNGKTLTKGTSYTVSYGTNKSTGKATVKITGKGNYTGSVTKTFYIVPKKVSTPTLKAGKKSITVKYKKVTGASGYQIAYQKSGSKSWTYTTVSSKSASKTLTKLTSKKNYKVKVRAYKTVSGKKYYGTYSATKTAKVK